MQTRVRFALVGDDAVGKSTLVEALCGRSASMVGGVANTGVHISVRLSADTPQCIEEYYDIAGAARFSNARRAVLRRPYDALILVHDLTDHASRTSLRRTWAPLAMLTLGDANALSAGGRVNGARHVRARGAWNELGLLWRHVRSAYSGISKWQAAKDALWLLVQFVVLVMHETGFWTDEGIDRAAERELLDGSTVPVAVVGMKGDLVAGEGDEEGEEERGFARGGRDIFVVHTSKGEVATDKKFARFLKRAADCAREGAFQPAHRRAGSNASSGHVALPF